MILPRVKQEETSTRTLRLDYRFSVCVDNKAYEEKAIRILGLFLPDAEVYAAETADITIAVDEQCRDTAEKYTLTVDEDVRIGYGDYKSLINALATLSQLAVNRDGYLLNVCDIVDYPANAYRGVLFDVGRGVKPLDEFKADVVTCAKAKYNAAHFHMNDTGGVCVRFDAIPESCYMPGAYTKEQLRQIIDLCGLLGIEAVPEWEAPFHSRHILTKMPHLTCEVPSRDNISRWAFCGGKEEVYDLCEAVIDEMCALFPGKYFNMCCDEVEFANHPSWNYLCHWTDCECCKALRKREGLRDRQEQIYYFMKRTYEMVKKRGKVPLMYSDQIDCTREDVMPKDIIFLFWTIATPGCGPYDGCSYEKQLAMGHKMIRMDANFTYLEAVKRLTAEGISNWDFKAAPSPELAANVMGSLMSCWQYGCNNNPTYNYQLKYKRGFAAAAYLFADRLWNDGTLPYKDAAYTQALTKAVLGPKTPDGLDILGCLIDPIPYHQSIEEMVDRDSLSVEEATRLLNILEQEACGDDAYAATARVMADIYTEAVDYLRGDES